MTGANIIRVRHVLSVALVVLSSVLVLVSTVAVWANRTVFDNDRFMASIEPVLDDPAVYDALSNIVTEQTLEVLELGERVRLRLSQLDEFLATTLLSSLDLEDSPLSRFDRPTLEVLAPPITERLENRVGQVVDEIITADAFRATLIVLVRNAHRAALAAIEADIEELPNVYVADGEVRLNLIPIIADVLREVAAEAEDILPDVQLPDVISDRVGNGRAQLADALNARVPDDFGQVTLMQEGTLSDVRDAVHQVQRLVWAELLLTVIVIAAAIAVSHRRRRTIVQLGIGAAAGLVIGIATTRRTQAAILDELTHPDGKRVAARVLTETISGLHTLALVLAGAGLLIAVAAYLAGRPRWTRVAAARGARLLDTASAGSAFDRTVARYADPLRIVTVALAVGVLFIIGIGWVRVIVVGALMALGLWAITTSQRRNTEAVPTPDAADVTSSGPNGTDQQKDRDD